MKGWIAVDIDGTITADYHSIPTKVVDYFRKLSKDGWQVAFITGRSWLFALPFIKLFDFVSFFSCQNGSSLFELPSQKLIFKDYMDRSHIDLLNKAFDEVEGNFIILSGRELNDGCFYSPSKISPLYRNYVEELKERENESWVEVDSFDVESFPLVKGVGSLGALMTVAERLKLTKRFETTIIKDPFSEGYHLLMITKTGVNKGSAINYLLKLKGRGAVVVTAGNDDNDFSLLKAGDVKIAIADSPDNLLKMADFIAPPPRDLGIISALETILKKY